MTGRSRKTARVGKDHLAVVEREEPRYAVAPDVTDGLSLEDAIGYADKLARFAETVIVVPKAVRPCDVPDRFRVGLPAQERFGGTPWPLWEYTRVPSVHVLGGSPTKQLDIADYVANIESVDTASPIKAAQFGSVWSVDGWQDAGINYYDRITRSMNGLLKTWNDYETVDFL